MLNKLKMLLLATAYFIANHVMMKIAPYFARHSYLRRVLKYSIGPDSSFCYGVFVTGPGISVGSNSVINRFCYLDGRGGLTIGNNVNISHYVLIQTLTHDYDSPVFQAYKDPVVVCDDVWVGARATILPGVTLGQGCVIGAGSVVTKNVPPFAVVVGSPARQVSTRSKDIKFKTRYRPFLSGDIQ